MTTLVGSAYFDVFCCVHFRQVLLRRLRRATGIYGRDRFEHTLFTHWRWQPVLRTSVLGYCRQTQQLNREHQLSVVKATRKNNITRQKIYTPPLFFFFLYHFAGQEKYRSISRQYLRKADGVLIVYDVTSEISFLHVRYWVDCVKVRNGFFFYFRVRCRLLSCGWRGYRVTGSGRRRDGMERGSTTWWRLHIINRCRVLTPHKDRFSSFSPLDGFDVIAGGGWRGRRLRAGGKQNRSTGRQSGPGVDVGTRRRSTNDRNINAPSPSCANNGRSEARPSTVLQLLT